MILATEERGEDFIEFLNAERTALLLSVDKKGWSRVDAKYFFSPISNGVHGVIDGLVFQAGFERFLCETGLFDGCQQGFSRICGA